jgi:ferredoxin-NADP reductase
MISAAQYKQRLAAGDLSMVHSYNACDQGTDEAPVMQLKVDKVEIMAQGIAKYEFTTLNGAPVPSWSAGAHLDVLISPEFLRQYSLSSDPKDLTRYQIGVLREEGGRGGSELLHRIFTQGRKVFVAKPVNHFSLDETATKVFLMGGGIGITPMIAFAHRLHAIGADFALHYSATRRDAAGFVKELSDMEWADHVHFHFSDEGSRAEFDAIFRNAPDGTHVYTCGADRFMQAVLEAAERQNIPEDARHFEYFSSPDVPEYENHPFKIKLGDGRIVHVDSDQTGAQALIEAGVHVDVKCSDGICGVCKCNLRSGEVEHRDFVLSNAQRAHTMILCQSRAADPDGEIEINF